MRRFLIASSKFIAAALVTFVCFELYFRTTEISLPSFVVDDPILGRTFKSNARAALVQEGFYMGRTNEYGYLGPAYPPERSGGALRVALVGDSYVEAFQLFPKWNVRAVLEAEMARRLGRNVEVLNFGRSGQDLRTMYLYYKDLVTRYQPDFVLFVVTDHTFTSRDNSIGPSCELDENGQLQVSYDFAQSDAYLRKVRLAFTRHFGSYQMIQNALYRYRRGETARILLDKFAPREKTQTEAPATTESKDRYFDVNRAVLEELGRSSRQGPSRIIIVGHREIPSYYEPVMAEAGLTFVDLRPELAEYQRSSGVNPYYWPVTNSVGHWNHAGHEVIGNHLAERLQQLAGP